MFINNISVERSEDGTYVVKTPHGAPVTVAGKDIDSFLRAVSQARHPALYQRPTEKLTFTPREGGDNWYSIGLTDNGQTLSLQLNPELVELGEEAPELYPGSLEIVKSYLRGEEEYTHEDATLSAGLLWGRSNPNHPKPGDPIVLEGLSWGAKGAVTPQGDGSLVVTAVGLPDVGATIAGAKNPVAPTAVINLSQALYGVYYTGNDFKAAQDLLADIIEKIKKEGDK